MSDLQYFRELLSETKDFTMQAFYETAVRLRNRGELGDCQHVNRDLHSERSYGSTYHWTFCSDCGEEFAHHVSEPW